MARRRFSLVFDPEVKKHLRAIEAKHHSLIRTTIEEQLMFEPQTEARNRKPLQRPAEFGATWEYICRDVGIAVRTGKPVPRILRG